MRSLFAKILLWFLATVVVAFVGFTVISIISYDDPITQPPLLRALSFQAREASNAYEAGGREALQKDLERVKEIFQADATLTDSKGLDLLTGENRSDLIAASQRRFFRRRNRAIVARRTQHGRYWFILSVPGEAAPGWIFPTGQLWVLGAVVLLCSWLARYLTSPLRSLQAALERFGQGDFSARTNSKRRDELGQDRKSVV